MMGLLGRWQCQPSVCRPWKERQIWFLHPPSPLAPQLDFVRHSKEATNPIRPSAAQPGCSAELQYRLKTASESYQVLKARAWLRGHLGPRNKDRTSVRIPQLSITTARQEI
jgi:hypothetical protein